MSMEKELVITLSEAETELVAAVNGIMAKHGLPCFLVEPILAKLHQQVINGKREELAQAVARAGKEDK